MIREVFLKTVEGIYVIWPEARKHVHRTRKQTICYVPDAVLEIPERLELLCLREKMTAPVAYIPSTDITLLENETEVILGNVPSGRFQKSCTQQKKTSQYR